jgi:hypothetical protein
MITEDLFNELLDEIDVFQQTAKKLVPLESEFEGKVIREMTEEEIAVLNLHQTYRIKERYAMARTAARIDLGITASTEEVREEERDRMKSALFEVVLKWVLEEATAYKYYALVPRSLDGKTVLVGLTQEDLQKWTQRVEAKDGEESKQKPNKPHLVN